MFPNIFPEFPEQAFDRCFADIHLPHCFAFSARHDGQHEKDEGQGLGKTLGWAEHVWLELGSGPAKNDSLFWMICSFITKASQEAG